MRVVPGHSLQGEVKLPGDKSISHRAILFSALAKGTSRIENLLLAGVTEKMLSAVKALGVTWQLEGSSLTVAGRGGGGLKSPGEPLDCGNSATTLRLLAGACAAAGVSATLTGSPGLRTRPMGRIVEPLQRMGVQIQALGEGGRAPLRITARAEDSFLDEIDYTSPVASAQVKSAVFLAGLAANGTLRYWEPGASRDHTERMLSNMGVDISSASQDDGSVAVVMEGLQGNLLAPLELTVPGDLSSAAFLIVAALITPGSEITLPGVGLNPTRTGLLEVLQEMGASITIQKRTSIEGEPAGEITVRTSRLRGIALSGSRVVRMIDEIPIFAVAAAYAEGETWVRDARELRYKETDRLTAVQRELSRLGVEIEEVEDGLNIQGGAPIQGGKADSYGDHRMAMSLAVAGLAAESPVQIEEAAIIQESFPGFIPALQQLGGEVAV